LGECRRSDPFKQIHSLKLSAYINWTAVLGLFRDVAVKIAQTGFGDNSWLTLVQVQREYGTIKKEAYIVDEISISAGHIQFDCEY